MSVLGLLLVAILFALCYCAMMDDGPLAGALIRGTLAGAVLGAVAVTLALYASTVLPHDPNRDSHNDWLILFIGPALGGVPGALVGAAAGALRMSRRRMAGWMLAVPFTGVCLVLLWVAARETEAGVLLVALVAAGLAGWGWRLVASRPDSLP